MATTDTEAMKEELNATVEANTPETTPANATTGTTGNVAGSTAAATTTATTTQNTTNTTNTTPVTSTPATNPNSPHPAYTDPTRIAGIENMYSKALEAQKASMSAAYEKNLGDLEANRGEIQKQYDAQRQSASIDFERNRRNLNQQMASMGLNTGTAAQSQLALQQQYNKMRGALGASEGKTNADLNKSIADLKIQYQGDINKAVADNDYNKAAALLDEYNTAYQQAMAKAQSLAQYGDFSGYAGIYGEDAARQMTAVWQIQNPLIAYNLGQIDAAKYKQITGTNPPGYSSGGGYSGPPKPKNEEVDSSDVPVLNDETSSNITSSSAPLNGHDLRRAEQAVDASTANPSKVDTVLSWLDGSALTRWAYDKMGY